MRMVTSKRKAKTPGFLGRAFQSNGLNGPPSDGSKQKKNGGEHALGEKK